jgi:zinc protease
MIRILALLLLLPLPLAAQNIQHVRSPGGLSAWLVEEHSIPFVALELVFEGGTSLDVPGKRGAINLMTGLLEEGAGDLDARAFATATQDLAAQFGFDVGRDTLTVSARFLTETQPQAIALLKTALTQPRFDSTALERVRAQVLSGIAFDETDPDAIASKAFFSTAFGDDPYGSPGEGTAASVAALSQTDMIQAHRNTIRRDNVFIGVAGDITADELAAVLDQLLGDLPSGGPAPLPPAPYTLPGGTSVIPLETPQSVALFGHQGIAMDDPDFFAAYILTHILGGSGFESRLMQEVREKRGLTYGVSAYLAGLDRAPMILGQVASANDRVAQAVQVIRDEWTRLASEGVSEAELNAAKTYLTGAYPLRFDGNGRIAGILAGMQLTGRPIDYPETRNAQVNAVTPADIARVAKRLLRPDQLHFTVVGQPNGL